MVYVRASGRSNLSLSVAGLLTVAVLGLGEPGCSGRGLSVPAEDIQPSEGSQYALNSNPQTTSFAVYAQNSANLRDRVIIRGGDVGVRQTGENPTLVSGYELVFSSLAKVETSHSVLANRLQMWDMVNVGDIQVNTLSIPHQNASYTRRFPFPSNMPPLPPLAAVSPGTMPVVVTSSSTVIGNPGSFGAVSIGYRGTWRLRGGVYHLASLNLDNEARIEALAPVQLRVAGRLAALDRVWIMPAAGTTLSAGDLRIEISGQNGTTGSLSDSPKSAQFGNDAHVSGVMLVRNGTLQFGARAVLKGAYLARDVFIDNDGIVDFQSGVGPSECLGSCDDGMPCTTDVCSVGTCTHGLVPAGTVCRPSGGPCDAPEACTGTGAACPADGFATPSTVCRPSAGLCDLPEFCTGTSVLCPDDGFVQASLECRPVVGPCDASEQCTGTGPLCPPDEYLPAATACRPSSGACDPAESCTGTSPMCPADNITGPPPQPAGLVATSGSGQISLAWSPSPGALGYNLSRSSNLVPAYAQIATIQSTSYDDVGLAIGPTYNYVVTAFSDCGESSPSGGTTSAPFSSKTETPSPTSDPPKLDPNDVVVPTPEEIRDRYGEEAQRVPGEVPGSPGSSPKLTVFVEPEIGGAFAQYTMAVTDNDLRTIVPDFATLLEGPLVLPETVSGQILVVGRANQEANFVSTIADPRWRWAVPDTPDGTTGGDRFYDDGGTLLLNLSQPFSDRATGKGLLEETTFEFYELAFSVPDSTRVSLVTLPDLLNGAVLLGTSPGSLLADWLFPPIP